jgi:hypothetical protein
MALRSRQLLLSVLRATRKQGRHSAIIRALSDPRYGVLPARSSN